MENPDVIMFGMMSSLRTGNMIVDMSVCMLLPMFFAGLWAWLQRTYLSWRLFLVRKLNMDRRRVIVHKISARPWYDAGNKEHENDILVAALRAYIGNEVKVEYPSADLKLSALKSKKSRAKGTLVDQLEQKFRTLTVPSKNEFVEIEPGLWYNEVENAEEQNEDDRGDRNAHRKPTNRIIKITFKCSRFDKADRIDKFVTKAYDWYCQRIEADEEICRFMYNPLVTDKTGEDAGKKTMYKRYALSDDKTFKSLFFPEKRRLLHLLDNFKSKSGKYAIKGFPHKMGLLLHGPPGTGKTSLVKAIAHHTKKNIVSVTLSKIRTNQELMDIMFDQRFDYKKVGSGGHDEDDGSGPSSNPLSFDDIIFLLEDVDAASKVVHTRQTQRKYESTMAREMSQTLEQIYAEEEKKKKEKEEKEKEEKKEEEEKKKKGGKKDSGTGGDKDKDKKKKDEDYSWEKDKLNLSGLLNVLDGVVDSPGRILIMTTNHPEKLDPAILRPGRINLQIYMGFMQLPHVLEMMNHYFSGKITEKDVDNITQMVKQLDSELAEGFRVTPAEMEQLCAESDTVDLLVTSLKEKALLKASS